MDLRMLTIILVSMTSKWTICQRNCDFHKDRFFMDCSRRELHSIPIKEFEAELKGINLSTNNIDSVQNGTFLNVHQLEVLDLSRNKIATFEPDAFLGLHRLLSLNLSHNSFPFDVKVFTPNLFEPLINLKEIKIERYLGEEGNWKGMDDSFSKLENLVSLTLDFPTSFIFGKGFQALSKLSILSSSGRDKYLGWLDLSSGCLLSALANDTFETLQDIPVTELLLVRCHICYIESGTFNHLSSLKVLDLSYNAKLQVRETLQCFHGLKRQNIAEIKLSMLNGYFRGTPSVLLAKDFSFLSEVCVKSLDLSLNYISILDRDFQKITFGCLERLNMSYHTIKFIPMNLLYALQDSQTLKYIDLSHGYGSSPSSDFPLKLPLPPNLLWLDISSVGWFNFLQELAFFPNFSLKYLNIGYNNFGGCQVPVVRGLQSLALLDISGTICDVLPAVYFFYVNNISSLKLSDGQNINMALRESQTAFGFLRVLEEIDLSSNELFELYSDIFQRNRRLHVISLRNNKFQRLPRAVLGLSNLSYLDLSSNAFTHLRPEETQLIDGWRAKSKSFVLLFKNNPLQCTCYTVLFIRWALQRKEMLDNPENYNCLQSNGTWVSLSTFEEHLADFEVKCVSHTYLIISAVAILTTILTILLFAGIYRYRLNLRYWLYSKLMPPENMFREQEYLFDAFVAYTSDEYEWVIRQLRPKLELVDTPARLCIHDRDFIPGKPIHENIVEKMKQSRKIMLIVSPGFLESRFGPLEIEYAGMKCLEEGRDDVIICVLMEDIPVRQMPRALRNLWHKITFLKWSGNPEAQVIFWRNLKAAVCNQAL